jgi:hypothetical protein
MAIVMSPQATWIAGHKYQAVEPASDLAELLDRIRRVHGHVETSVLLTEHYAHQLGFPARLPQGPAREQHPSLTTARELGWRITQLAPNMSCWHPDRPSIHLAVAGWLTTGNTMWWQPDNWQLMSYTLSRYAHLVGVPFRMTPGTTGVALIRDQFPQDKRTLPYWRPDWSGIDPAHGPTEVAIRWHSDRDFDALPYRHTYDVNMQFLSAAINAELAFDGLHHEIVTKFDGRAGYWQITVPPWNETRLPHPTGHHTVGNRVWVTAPTVNLLLEIAEKYGMIGDVEIHQAWVSNKTGRLLRWWGEILRDGIVMSESELHEGARELLKDMLKATYKQAIGMLTNERSRVDRRDWNHTLVGTARANEFRVLLYTGLTENKWPESIHHDAVTYRSDVADPTLFAPRKMKLRPGLGGWKFTTREVVAA